MALCLPKHKFFLPTSYSQPTLIFTRLHSTSPYGRSHVRMKHPRRLPAPVVPHFLQQVTRADGSTFTHWTTSPRSKILLSRDTTNHPLWNATERLLKDSESTQEEDEATGRIGRWRRRFGSDMATEDLDRIQEGVATEVEPALKKQPPPKPPRKK
ncbi:hypothetical protein F5I97DRAFT_1969927 [Phlebopus sp. FC_14]|nr:hypothetical protein F5I97DRAFT_1969927 [Phlebopus sp. FC_14]